MLKMKSMFERKKILPLVLTLANSILNKLGFVELINRTVAYLPLSDGCLIRAFYISALIKAPMDSL